MADAGARHLAAAAQHYAALSPPLAESIARCLVDRLQRLSTSSAALAAAPGLAPGEICPACGALWPLSGLRASARQRRRPRRKAREVEVVCVCGARAALPTTVRPAARSKDAAQQAQGGARSEARAGGGAAKRPAAAPEGKAKVSDAARHVSQQAGSGAGSQAKDSSARKKKKNKLGKALLAVGSGAKKGQGKAKDKRFKLGDFLNDLT